MGILKNNTSAHYTKQEIFRICPQSWILAWERSVVIATQSTPQPSISQSPFPSPHQDWTSSHSSASAPLQSSISSSTYPASSPRPLAQSLSSTTSTSSVMSAPSLASLHPSQPSPPASSKLTP